MAITALPAHAEPLTCQGKAVTVEGATGTEGDDVMVVGPGQRSASAGAGNDLVCIRLSDDLRASFFLGAGPGEDVVHNESTDGTRYVSVLLGTGADTYAGSDASRENVSTGPDSWGGTGDTEKDVVDTRGGNDSVSTRSVTPGTPNPDVISTGAGDDGVIWTGEHVGAPVDLGAGENRLSLKSGWAGDDIDIDATAGVVTAGSRPVLRWTGDVTDYSLQYTHLRTTFTGTGLDEHLTFWPSQADQQGPPSSVGHPESCASTPTWAAATTGSTCSMRPAGPGWAATVATGSADPAARSPTYDWAAVGSARTRAPLARPTPRAWTPGRPPRCRDGASV